MHELLLSEFARQRTLALVPAYNGPALAALRMLYTHTWRTAALWPSPLCRLDGSRMGTSRNPSAACGQLLDAVRTERVGGPVRVGIWTKTGVSKIEDAHSLSRSRAPTPIMHPTVTTTRGGPVQAR